MKIPCACDDEEQPGLFCVPVAPKKKRVRQTPVALYARFKPKTRTLCADCIAEIHRLGVAKAPLPRPVRWRRSTPDGTTHLCEHHKDLRVEQESNGAN